MRLCPYSSALILSVQDSINNNSLGKKDSWKDARSSSPHISGMNLGHENKQKKNRKNISRPTHQRNHAFYFNATFLFTFTQDTVTWLSCFKKNLKHDEMTEMQGWFHTNKARASFFLSAMSLLTKPKSLKSSFHIVVLIVIKYCLFVWYWCEQNKFPSVENKGFIQWWQCRVPPAHW